MPGTLEACRTAAPHVALPANEMGQIGAMFLKRMIERLPAGLRAKIDGGIAKNVGWLLGDRLARLAITLAVGALVARHLGPMRYGSLAYALALIAFFIAIASLSSDGVIVRDMVRHPDRRGEVLGSAMALRALLGLSCWLLAIVIVLTLEDRTAALLVGLTGTSLIFQAVDAVDLWFQSELQSRRTVAAKFPAYLISNATRAILVFSDASLPWFAAAFTLDAAMAATFLAIAYRRYPVPGGLRADGARMLGILRESVPFMLTGLSVILYMRIDQIMLRQMVGLRELGIFAAALPFSQIWQFIPMTLMASLAPMVARQKAESQATYENTLLTIYRAFGAMALLYSAATALAAPFIIPLLYGQGYAGSVPVLAIIAFTNVPVALGLAQSLWITNEKAGMIGLGKTIAGGVVAVVANYVLLPRYGAIGAAISANLSFFTSAILSNLILAPHVFLSQLGIGRRRRSGGSGGD